MDAENTFYRQLEILGQLPSALGREKALSAVFASMKLHMSPDQVKRAEAAVPDWLKPRWLQAPASIAGPTPGDLVDLIKILGDYGYRGAAQRVFKAVMGSLVEILDPEPKRLFSESLPEAFMPFWEEAQGCSLGATMGQYL
jgi:uncharacterized protein (DUF2267 family)